jgi:HlyD family secretion protein
MKPNRKWLVAVLVLAVLAVPFVVKKSQGRRGIEVEIATVAEHAIRPTILASGTLAYLTEVNLTSEVLAKVAEVMVAEGEQVARGQVLLRLDPETQRNAIEREEASRRQSLINIERQRLALALRRKQFERSERLLAARMIDQSRFDEDSNLMELADIELRGSEEALRRAETVLRDARELLDKTDIRSPIDGTVVALAIKVGETAIPSTSALVGAQMMRIADTSALQAELKVDEADIAKIGIGQRADIYAAAYPDTAISGTVQQIAMAPIVENQGRAYKVTVLLQTPPELALRSGMSARADIFLGDGIERLAVPVEAIASEQDEDKKTSRFVWRVEDGQAKKVEVEVGASDDRWEEVRSGLAAGEQIVTGPAKTLRRLREGERVSAKPAADAAARTGTTAAEDRRDADGDTAT